MDRVVKMRRFVWIVVASVALLCGWGLEGRAFAQRETRCFTVEVYYRQGDDASTLARAAVEKYTDAHKGLNVKEFDVDAHEQTPKRLAELAKYFGLKEVPLPAVYCCKSLLFGFKDEKELARRLDLVLTMTVFVRAGCPHCAAGREFLRNTMGRYPAMRIVYREITSDPSASADLRKLTERYRARAASVPVFHFCNGIISGYDRDATTGKTIQQQLEYWSKPCPKTWESSAIERPAGELSSEDRASRMLPLSLLPSVWLVGLPTVEGADPPAPVGDLPPPPAGDDLPPPPGGFANDPPDGEGLPPPPVAGDLPLPGDSLPPPPASADPSATSPAANPYQQTEVVDVPVFGKVDASETGMLGFTFLVGLVDGFNPCAMWVLLFLLSLLVNLKSRKKMAAIAGVFVIISGVAYYAFMAAWLNVFMWAGYLKGVQTTLGLLAIFVGAIHVKDFFAFKQGLSLSIPESAKPGIYARVRGIVTAESLWAALAGAVVLAVLVNMIELLCTMGLPVAYTKVLTMQGYPTWKYYGYLGVYILAYMLDDTVMVVIAVATLGRRKLQEKEGRWLKLVSGVAILAFGVVMVFKPEWLT